MATDTPINKTGSKSLEDWKAEIKLALRYRRLYGRSNEWSRYKNYYRGFFKEGTVPVNIIFAIGRSMIPQVYFRNPRVGIVPLKPGFTMHARVLERLDNWLIQEMNLKNTLKSMVLDSYLCGRGMGILGYDSEYGFDQSLIGGEILGDVSLSTFSAKSGDRIEYNHDVAPGMPWFLRCNPVDFIVPWGTNRWEEAPWFGYRKMRPLRDILEDPKYENKTNLRAIYQSKLDNSDRERENVIKNEDSKTEWVEVWQIHDQKTGKVLAISLDHDKFLRDDQDGLQIEGLPARVIGFNEDPDYFWWTPDCRLIEQQQLEMNDIRTMAKHHRRVAILKVLYDKGMVSKDALSKLLDGDVKAAVEIDAGASGDIRKAVALFQSHVPPDLAASAREVREDIREIVGFSRNQMGSFEESSGRRTAHEAEIVRAASMIRIDERRDAMADLLASTMRGVNQIIFQNWTEEKIIDVIGPDGARYWIRFTGKDIKGEFAERVNPEEAQPENRNVQIMQNEKFIDIATKIPGMDMKYLMESYASRFDWIDPKMLFPGQGAGRSPEKAMQFYDFMRMGGQGGGAMSQALAPSPLIIQ